VTDGERLSFVGRELPDDFACRRVTIEPGSERPYDAADWAGAVIIVEEGELELECRGGSRSRFASGSVLFFESLPLRTLRNCGDGPVLLTSVSRR
jgi:quercetin dioxygenase-like cupin family protein